MAPARNFHLCMYAMLRNTSARSQRNWYCASSPKGSPHLEFSVKLRHIQQTTWQNHNKRNSESSESMQSNWCMERNSHKIQTRAWEQREQTHKHNKVALFVNIMTIISGTKQTLLHGRDKRIGQLKNNFPWYKSPKEDSRHTHNMPWLGRNCLVCGDWNAEDESWERTKATAAPCLPAKANP